MRSRVRSGPRLDGLLAVGALVSLVGVSCTFDASGLNMEPGGSGSTGGATHGSGSSNTTGELSTGEIDPDASLGAMLQISGEPSIMLEPVVLGMTTTMALTIRNAGQAEATELKAQDLEPPFGFANGEFPGQQGSCIDRLQPGQTCEIVVAFSPEQLGPVMTSLVLSYNNSVDNPVATLSHGLLGEGTGTSANLLMNPGGEDAGSPPPRWQVQSGDWYTTDEVLPVTGSAVIAAGLDSNVDEMILQQQVVLPSAWGALLDDGTMQLHFEGAGRARAVGDDRLRLRVRYLDGAGEVLEVVDHLSFLSGFGWERVDLNLETTTTTGVRTVEVQLICHKEDDDERCHAYFDDLNLTANYSP